MLRKGSGPANQSLTAEDVRLIRKLYGQKGMTLEALGLKFDVCSQTIWRVVHYETYRWVRK